jgi:hypothetical protein
VHVIQNLGPLYPIGFTKTVNNEEFIFILAGIHAKNDLLFLFSVGLYLYESLIEIGFVLPYRWSLLKNYLQGKSRFAFPLDILEIMSSHIARGKGFGAGSVIEKNDPLFSELG